MNLNGEIYSFEEAPLYQESAQAYIETGIDIFDSKNHEAIPNLSTNSYPHAHSIVKLLKKFKTTDRKLKILECGAGNGIFARHFLIACQKEGLIDKVEYLISDFNFRIVKDLRSRNLYQGFKENTHFRYLKLDLMNMDECIDIKGKGYELADIDLVIMNYSLHALPCSIYKKDNQMLEKLYVEFLEQDHKSSEPIKEFWMPKDKIRFEINEKKYLPLLEQLIDQYTDQEKIHFNFNALNSLEQLFEKMSSDAFIYISDIPQMELDTQIYYRSFSEATAYILNSHLISNFTKSLGYWEYVHNDFILYKHIISKKQPNSNFKKTLTKNFETKNPCVLFCELTAAMKVFISNQSHKAYKSLLKEFMKIDDVSVHSKLFQAIYHMKIGKFQKSQKLFEEAKKINFFSSCDIEQHTKKLELLIEKEELLKSIEPKLTNLFKL